MAMKPVALFYEFDTVLARLALLPALVAALMLGGCATTSDLMQTNPDPLFVAPASAQSLPVDMAKYAGAPDSCEQNWLKGQRPLQAVPSDVDRFAAVMACSLTGEVKQHNRFVQVGRLLAARQCDVFMDSLEDKRVHVGYNQTNMNTLVTAAAAVLAKSGHHAQSIFNLATGAVAANSLIDNYRANYVMTHSLFQLREKIREGRAVLDRTIDDNIERETYQTFDQAKQDLLDYGDWCSHKTLVHIINSALRETKIEADGPADALAEKNKQQLFDKAKAANDKIPGKAFTDRQFALLFAIANRASKPRIDVIAKLDTPDPTKKTTKWDDPLKAPDVALIAKALKLDSGEGDGNADMIVTIGRLTGFESGAGSKERSELNLALGVLDTPPAAGTAAIAPKPAAKGMTVAERRSKLTLRAVHN